MGRAWKRLRRYVWPESLFGRLTVAWVSAFFLGHVLNGVLAFSQVLREEWSLERTSASKEIATAVAILERVTPPERAGWLPTLSSDRLRYELGAPLAPEVRAPSDSPVPDSWTRAVQGAVGPGHAVRVTPLSSAGGVRVEVRLADGASLRAQVAPYHLRIALWPGGVFFVQMLALLGLTWIAVRQAMRPLARLASEAERLGSSLACEPIPEEGPIEVVRAAAAFNAMQRRIAAHLAERIQILAAISHDLQTPITRMRLRADLMGDGGLREKLEGDLDAMQALVEEGIAYARSAHGAREPASRIDLDALVESLVCDWTDAGRAVRLEGQFGGSVVTRPQALRRIVTNLVENALKFGDAVEVRVERGARGGGAITVLDRGPGIPPGEIARVLEPFYRVEGSRSRATGGTGLGLAIANQLASGVGGALPRAHREGGGLAARIDFAALEA